MRITATNTAVRMISVVKAWISPSNWVGAIGPGVFTLAETIDCVVMSRIESEAPSAPRICATT